MLMLFQLNRQWRLPEHPRRSIICRGLTNKEYRAYSHTLNTDHIYLSFYKYANIPRARKLQKSLLKRWKEKGITGRIYVANEGINAQMSIPADQYGDFVNELKSISDEYSLGEILYVI